LSEVVVEVLAEALTKIESHATNLALELIGLEKLSLCDGVRSTSLSLYLRVEGVGILEGWKSVVGLCLWINEVTNGEAKLLIERVKRL
jgi:hypothetical protein